MLFERHFESRALLFGHEESLLKSRKWLLAAAGCESIIATTLTEYREMLLSHPLSLIILCQTASSDECNSATSFAAKHLPQAQLLVMFSRSAKCEPEQEYVMLDTMAGPEAFLKTTQRMLENSSSRATYAI